MKVLVSRNDDLREVVLRGASMLTDKSINHILNSCPNIVNIAIKGNPSELGHIKGNFCSVMNQTKNRKRWSRFKGLLLEDQELDQRLVRSLYKKRPGLQIWESRTLSLALAGSLSQAGVFMQPGETVQSRWRTGHVVGRDWMDTIRSEEARSADMRRLANSLRNEAHSDAHGAETQVLQTREQTYRIARPDQ
jgi:hypothetical protein